LLESAVAAFLENAGERELDEPLLAVLRARGYTELHLVHGPAEFGKDIIGQRDQEQWAFQSKAGDIGQGDWRQMSGQLDELRLSDLSHPGFRTDLPRRAVLVTTGRLRGNAPLSAQEYNNRARGRAEPELEIWSRDRLLGELAGNPDALLRGSMDGQLMGMMAAVEANEVDIDRVELFSRRWTSWESDRLASLGVVEAALLCERLVRAHRLDLACQLGLALVRGTVAASAADPESADVAMQAAGALFATYAQMLWNECDDRLLSEGGLVGVSRTSAWVTYQLRCTRIAELLALHALRLHDPDQETASGIAEWIARFLEAQPGTCRPLGDRYAVGLIPVALILRGHEQHLLALLTNATIWVCDRNERGQLGVGASDATVDEEIARVLGSSIGLPIESRRSSLIASVLLDLAAVYDLRELYSDIRNDLLAVGVSCPVLLTGSGAGRYTKPAVDARWDYDADYADDLGDEPAAPHLAQGPHADTLVERGLWWELLAVSAVLRDRWFTDAIRAALDR
jgi:hypothetical protein